MNDFTLPAMLVWTFPKLQKTCLYRHVFFFSKWKYLWPVLITKS